MPKNLHDPAKRFDYVSGNLSVSGLVRLFLLIVILIFIVGNLSARELVTPAERAQSITVGAQHIAHLP